MSRFDSIPLHLSPEHRSRIAAIARLHGVPPDVLVHYWLMFSVAHFESPLVPFSRRVLVWLRRPLLNFLAKRLRASFS